MNFQSDNPDAARCSTARKTCVRPANRRRFTSVSFILSFLDLADHVTAAAARRRLSRYVNFSRGRFSSRDARSKAATMEDLSVHESSPPPLALFKNVKSNEPKKILQEEPTRAQREIGRSPAAGSGEGAKNNFALGLSRFEISRTKDCVKRIQRARRANTWKESRFLPSSGFLSNCVPRSLLVVFPLLPLVLVLVCSPKLARARARAHAFSFVRPPFPRPS